MEIYSTEEQQVEAIKGFWKEYGTSIIIGAVVGLGGLYGWNWYSDAKVAKTEAASAAYQQLTANISDEAALLKAVEAFNAAHKDAGYTMLAELLVAKTAVDAKDYAKAEASLKKVVADKTAGSVAAVASLRLARIQAEQGQTDSAIATLDAVTDAAFVAQRDEIKGDIFAAKGEKDKAKVAYQAALDKSGIAASPVLKMKLDNLNQA